MGLWVTRLVGQAQNSQPDLDRALQSATARYEAKDDAEAQKELEPLLARFPNSFEVNELTGLVYAAQGQEDEANRYLENAAPHRTNRGGHPLSGEGSERESNIL